MFLTLLLREREREREREISRGDLLWACSCDCCISQLSDTVFAWVSRKFVHCSIAVDIVDSPYTPCVIEVRYHDLERFPLVVFSNFLCFTSVVVHD